MPSELKKILEDKENEGFDWWTRYFDLLDYYYQVNLSKYFSIFRT